MSPRSSNSRRRHEEGFTLIEMLIAATVLVILLGLVGNALVSSLRIKQSETQIVEVQQNLRSALQLMSQDLRAGAFLHLWHDDDCSGSAVCSTADRVAVVTTDGTMTTIPEPPGSSYTNSAETNVCDARQFNDGDVALVYNNGVVDLIEVTKTQIQADHSKPCKGPPGSPNRDKIQHNKDKLTGQWSASSYLYRAIVASYYLAPDPVEADRLALFRQTGLGTPQEQSGLVAFGVSELSFDYGVPVDPTAAASQLIFYPTLEAAAAALGGNYSAYPRTPGKTYVGSVVEAVRVRLVGETKGTGGNEPRTFELTETVELRR